MRKLCAEQKLGSKDILKAEGLKDMHYRILKILGEDALNDEEKAVSDRQ